MNKYNFKVGDWCFCEWELKQITKIENNKILETSDGSFSHGGNLTDRCFPLDMKIKQISDSFEYYYKPIRDIKLNINHPDIHWKFVDMWIEMCEHKDDKNFLEIGYKNIENFQKDILEKIEQIKNMQLRDIYIMRQIG